MTNNHNEVTTKRFRVSEAMQVMIEVYYDPYFYDLEVSLTSLSALSSTRHHRYASSQVDWSLYKGAKRLFVELEPGEYEFKLTQ